MITDTVELKEGAIRYRTRGEGPPLVLLSTLGGTWMRQTPVLSKHFTVITYDMRGFGDSPSSVGFPSNADHADDLAELLTALGYDKAAVAGLSHGGIVAQHFAGRHPERLSALALVATFAKARESTELFLRMLYGFLERDDMANFWEVLRSFLFSAANAEVLDRRESLLKQAMFDQYTTAALRSVYGQARTHDSTGFLGPLPCPTLVVGGLQDMLFPVTATEELAALIPGARTVLLPAAHIPPVESPRAFNDVLLDFLGEAR
ncbi:alpha/beta fold hydrolase [Actinocorallia sp. A-T 12471]|uniref:alpha/beta fold hydrolase n=1 Tax=Actinocorallia sp. A-T 12471 TaxID=3089813 RepID=UPI0029D11B45|nr:alpha/beta fold hydrolase [Actinocorallia sp. A-T 12471]MDX6742361.1 alpha/beta fold hydrolase [Actinocorallia sp. A-T 12471]